MRESWYLHLKSTNAKGLFVSSIGLNQAPRVQDFILGLAPGECNPAAFLPSLASWMQVFPS
jgi:hypothetical protein